MTPWKYKLTDVKTNEVHTIQLRSAIDNAYDDYIMLRKLAEWSGIKIGPEHPWVNISVKFGNYKKDKTEKIKLPHTVKLTETVKDKKTKELRTVTLCEYKIEVLVFPEYSADAEEREYFRKHGHWSWMDKKEDD